MLPSFILIVRPSAYRRQAILLLLRRVALELGKMSAKTMLKSHTRQTCTNYNNFFD
jgi:hypothetical protein